MDTPNYGRKGPREIAARSGFTILELHVAVAVLGIGLLSLVGLMARQSRHISSVESWCTANPTFYVVSQTNPWMQTLGVSADLYDRAGQTAWSPPVSASKTNAVTLGDIEGSFSAQTLTAQVTVTVITGANGAVSNSGIGTARKIGFMKK